MIVIRKTRIWVSISFIKGVPLQDRKEMGIRKEKNGKEKSGDFISLKVYLLSSSFIALYYIS